MAAPSWLVKPPVLVGESTSEIEWSNGYPMSVQRRYAIEVEIPPELTTAAAKEAWYTANIEGAQLTGASSPFYGIPEPLAFHPQHTNLVALSHRISTPGYLSKRVLVTVTFSRPEASPSNQTDRGNVSVPFGSWGTQVSWTIAKLAGADYRGSPLMTLAGEVVNVQCNVAVYTLTRSVKTSSTTVNPPSINKEATSIAGFVIPKHCGLRSQSNVENTGEDAGDNPRILTDQIVYIPRMVSVAVGTIVNADEGANGEIKTLADVGSHDILILHQGYREKVNGKVDFVSYHDTTSGKKATLNALSVLDETGKHVVPDPDTGLVTPYYLAFQIYPSASW